MRASARRFPLSFATGALIAAAGVLLAALGPSLRFPVIATLAVVAVAAAMELTGGISLMRHHGAAIAHILGGAITLAFVGFIMATAIIDSSVMSPAPVALIIGVYCLTNGIVRGLDVVIDRPRAALLEGLDAVATLALGVVVLSRWGAALPGFVAVVGGLELLVRGLSLAGSARVAARHPDLTPYRGYEERLAPIRREVARANPPQ